jgi:hypothetical protein
MRGDIEMRVVLEKGFCSNKGIFMFLGEGMWKGSWNFGRW